MNDKQFTIGQVSKMVGLPAKTIRFYEEKGIFKPLQRADNKYRIFSSGDIRKLRLIKALRGLDIPLTDIKELVEKCTQENCQAAKEYAENKLPDYILSVDKKIKQLGQLKAELTFLKKNFSEMVNERR